MHFQLSLLLGRELRCPHHEVVPVVELECFLKQTGVLLPDLLDQSSHVRTTHPQHLLGAGNEVQGLFSALRCAQILKGLSYLNYNVLVAHLINCLLRNLPERNAPDLPQKPSGWAYAQSNHE